MRIDKSNETGAQYTGQRHKDAQHWPEQNTGVIPGACSHYYALYITYALLLISGSRNRDGNSGPYVYTVR